MKLLSFQKMLSTISHLHSTRVRWIHKKDQHLFFQLLHLNPQRNVRDFTTSFGWKRPRTSKTGGWVARWWRTHDLEDSHLNLHEVRKKGGPAELVGKSKLFDYRAYYFLMGWFNHQPEHHLNIFKLRSKIWFKTFSFRWIRWQQNTKW